MYAIFIKPAESDKIEKPPQKECPEAEALLKEFADVFPDKLPPGLPPVRGVQHRLAFLNGNFQIG